MPIMNNNRDITIFNEGKNGLDWDQAMIRGGLPATVIKGSVKLPKMNALCI
jgi:hypothetical protein